MVVINETTVIIILAIPIPKKPVSRSTTAFSTALRHYESFLHFTHDFPSAVCTPGCREGRSQSSWHKTTSVLACWKKLRRQIVTEHILLVWNFIIVVTVVIIMNVLICIFTKTRLVPNCYLQEHRYLNKDCIMSLVYLLRYCILIINCNFSELHVL